MSTKDEVRVYPYLIDYTRITGYYELLLEDGYELKVFDKKEDNDIYMYFLPRIREYLFWTFNLDKLSEYRKLPVDMKAAICGDYKCNIFTKKETTVMCFSTGICFAITSNKKEVNSLIKYQEKERMKRVNIREDESYDLKDIVKEKDKYKEAHMYAYLLELNKKIFLNIVEKEIEDDSRFEKTRNLFAEFTKKLYNIDVTDKDGYVEEIRKEMKTDKKYIVVEEKFDVLYKNIKLNDSSSLEKICFALFIVLVIIGVINLGLWLNH